MLESEAKRKWCPMTRTGEIHRGAAVEGFESRNEGIAYEGFCIGSACAMWEAGRERLVAPTRALVEAFLERNEGWEEHRSVDGAVTLTRPPNGDCGLKRG